LLGFEVTTTYGKEAAFISAGGYHHHIGLNVWISKNGSPAPKNATGLFHTALLYPTRKDLAKFLSVYMMLAIHFQEPQTMGFLKHFTWMTPTKMAWSCIGIDRLIYGQKNPMGR